MKIIKEGVKPQQSKKDTSFHPIDVICNNCHTVLTLENTSDIYVPLYRNGHDVSQSCFVCPFCEKKQDLSSSEVQKANLFNFYDEIDAYNGY